ncbi:MAG: hypothetical protein TUN42_04230 [Dehalogenimonas sp.]
MAKKPQVNPMLPPMPSNWVGSYPEWAVYWALQKLGYTPGQDFTYQSAHMGGRQQFGGAIVDFEFPILNMAINVQSTYYHYRLEENRLHDVEQRAIIEGMGIRMIYIDEEDALRDPIYYTQEALAGRDYSRMTGGA